jgi:hypothetical protein
VDEVTQWEAVGATAQIGEAWLIPVLDAMRRANSVLRGRFLGMVDHQNIHRTDAPL